MARTKSVVLHAIKTNHFPEFTWLFKQFWKRLNAFPGHEVGIHFSVETDNYANDAEKCIMRGWSVCYPEWFNFTTTHDLCDASFSRKGLELLVKHLYENELNEEKDAAYEFDRRHPECASIPFVGKRITEYSLDEYIWDRCA